MGCDGSGSTATSRPSSTTETQPQRERHSAQKPAIRSPAIPSMVMGAYGSRLGGAGRARRARGRARPLGQGRRAAIGMRESGAPTGNTTSAPVRVRVRE